MATITSAPSLSINQNNNGTSNFVTVFSVAFDAFDRASDQPYSVHIKLIGDDTNVGDPATAGPDDDPTPTWEFPPIRASDYPAFPPFPPTPPLVYTKNLPTTWLNEDKVPESNSSDEIRAIVTLRPQPAKSVSAESVLVPLTL